MSERKALCFIGVDPALRHTGVAVVQGEICHRAHTMDCAQGEYSNRGFELSAWMNRFADEVVLCARTYRNIAAALIEGYSYASRGNATLLQAEVGGIARAVLGNAWPVIEVPPGTWRALTLNRYKINPGKGRKAEMAKYLDAIEEFFGWRFATTHEAEAALMCRAAEVALSGDERLTGGGKKLREAIKAVAWQAR